MLARITFITGIIGLIGVYTLEYFFGFAPCDLCTKQRILVAILISVSLFSWIVYKFRKKESIICNILITIVVSLMFALAIFQVGVENNIFELPETCGHGIQENQNIEDLRESLLSSESLKPSCNVPQVLFGLSIATWSLFGTFILFLITIRCWFLRFKK